MKIYFNYTIYNMRINVSNRFDFNDSCLKIHPLKLISFLLFNEIYYTYIFCSIPKLKKYVFKKYKNKKLLNIVYWIYE